MRTSDLEPIVWTLLAMTAVARQKIEVRRKARENKPRFNHFGCYGTFLSNTWYSQTVKYFDYM